MPTVGVEGLTYHEEELIWCTRTALAELELARHVDAFIVDEELRAGSGRHRPVVVLPDFSL